MTLDVTLMHRPTTTKLRDRRLGLTRSFIQAFMSTNLQSCRSSDFVQLQHRSHVSGLHTLSIKTLSVSPPSYLNIIHRHGAQPTHLEPLPDQTLLRTTLHVAHRCLRGSLPLHSCRCRSWAETLRGRGGSMMSDRQSVVEHMHVECLHDRLVLRVFLPGCFVVHDLRHAAINLRDDSFA